MTCRRAHRLLAAYRRDDWFPRDRAALGQHLSTCSACRRIEFSYRGVGESVRQLPSITPPPGFREAVFAAIRADEQRMERKVAAMTEADTSPELPVIPAPRRPISLAVARRERAIWLNPRVALVAAAAVVMLGLLSTQLLPHSGLANLAASLGIAHTNNNPATNPSVTRYMPDAQARSITRALATTGWLVYSATDSTGTTTIFAENRQTKAITTLARGSSVAPVMLRAVTKSWAFWSAGSGSSWTLYAGRPGSNAAPVALLTSGTAASSPAALSGVWADDHAALVAITTRAGTSQVLRFALSATKSSPDAPVMVAQTTTMGHALTDPTADGASIYWTEDWRDASGQHSQLWSRDAAGQAHLMGLNASAVAPHVTNGLLIWVEGQRGTLEARTLGASKQQWIVAQSVDSSSVRVAGAMVFWRAGGVLHAWDARTHRSSLIDGQLGSAAWAEASDSSVVWAGPGGSINVYDVV